MRAKYHREPRLRLSRTDVRQSLAPRTVTVRRALISDIHGNLEALVAVLDDIASQRIDEIFCLGDIVGYGPNPRECIDRVMDSVESLCLATRTNTLFLS